MPSKWNGRHGKGRVGARDQDLELQQPETAEPQPSHHWRPLEIRKYISQDLDAKGGIRDLGPCFILSVISPGKWHLEQIPNDTHILTDSPRLHAPKWGFLWETVSLEASVIIGFQSVMCRVSMGCPKVQQASGHWMEEYLAAFWEQVQWGMSDSGLEIQTVSIFSVDDTHKATGFCIHCGTWA